MHTVQNKSKVCHSSLANLVTNLVRSICWYYFKFEDIPLIVLPYVNKYPKTDILSIVYILKIGSLNTASPIFTITRVSLLVHSKKRSYTFTQIRPIANCQHKTDLLIPYNQESIGINSPTTCLIQNSLPIMGYW